MVGGTSSNTLIYSQVYTQPELLVQKFLRCGQSLEDLKAKFAINYRFHSEYPNLVTLKYNQIDSPMGEPIVQECRGIILDQNKNWDVVAYGLNKFFNISEGHAAKINWATASVLEKLDGSLCLLYYYDDKWHVATSGTPDASGEVGDSGHTFKELFWKTWNDLEYVLPPCNSHTYMFELMTPYNRIVVPHKKSQIVLIGERNIISYQELNILGQQYPWPKVKIFDLDSVEKIVESFASIDPMNQEGYVVVDGNFNRVKIKHPGYVALHHMASSLSVKAVLEIIRAGEIGEILSYFPEWSETFREIGERLDTLVNEIEKEYSKIKIISERKEFASHATKTRLPAALFSLKDNKVNSVKEYVRQMNVNSLKDLLNLSYYKIVLNYIKEE